MTQSLSLVRAYLSIFLSFFPYFLLLNIIQVVFVSEVFLLQFLHISFNGNP